MIELWPIAASAGVLAFFVWKLHLANKQQAETYKELEQARIQASKREVKDDAIIKDLERAAEINRQVDLARGAEPAVDALRRTGRLRKTDTTKVFGD